MNRKHCQESKILTSFQAILTLNQIYVNEWDEIQFEFPLYQNLLFPKKVSKDFFFNYNQNMMMNISNDAQLIWQDIHY